MKKFNKTDDRKQVSEYQEKVIQYFSERFATAHKIFPDSNKVIRPFKDACKSVLKHGWGEWQAVENRLNELCIALAILESPNYRVTSLEYEPSKSKGDTSVDFVAQGDDGMRWIVDVKTITPDYVDQWEQFEKAKEGKWFTPRTDIILTKDGMGGEIWHSMQAARTRMLEYTLELEDKLSARYPDFDAHRTLLMFCSNGFHWHEDQLEDFVEFYVTGAHRADDPLGVMEQNHIEEKCLQLPHRVKRFGYMEREGRALDPSRICWQVIPPRFPP